MGSFLQGAASGMMMGKSIKQQKLAENMETKQPVTQPETKDEQPNDWSFIRSLFAGGDQ